MFRLISSSVLEYLVVIAVAVAFIWFLVKTIVDTVKLCFHYMVEQLLAAAKELCSHMLREKYGLVADLSATSDTQTKL